MCPHSNSPWLADHPEAAYNLDNSPHLAAAVELDQAMLDVSAAVASGEKAVSPIMNSAAAVDAVVDLLRDEALPVHKLWEYYQVDVDAAVQACEDAVAAGGSTQCAMFCCRHRVSQFRMCWPATRGNRDAGEGAGDDMLLSAAMDAVPELTGIAMTVIANNGTASRFPVVVSDPAPIAKHLLAYLQATGQQLQHVDVAWTLSCVFEAVNSRLSARYDDDIQAAINAIRGGYCVPAKAQSPCCRTHCT